jgi:hypothetical protein
MAAGGFIDITTPYRQFEAPGRCIYCRRKASALQKEHIIPFGLAADSLVFRKASCAKCGKQTRDFETVCLRHMWWPFRTKVGVPTRNKRQIPTAFRLERLGRPSIIKDGHIEPGSRVVETLPAKDFPLFYCTYAFQRPGILTGRAQQDDTHTGLILVDTQQANKQINPMEGFSFSGNVLAFCKLLGKIAHGYAVAELGVDAFTPALTLSLRKKATNFRLTNWIGSTNESSGPPTSLHEIELRLVEVGSAKYVVVHIRLFASLPTPRYEVVVGELKPSFDQLSLFEKPLYRIEMKSPLPVGEMAPVVDISGRTRGEIIKLLEEGLP